VEGFNANGCGTLSEPDTVNASLLQSPEICIVTVDTATNRNLIVWEKPVSLSIADFNIYRETNQAGIYTLAETVPYDSLSIFIDTLSNPQIKSYRYEISAVDTCGNESGLSPHHRTLHLMISQAVPQGYNLDWQDSYEGFSFLSYVIYRGSSPQTLVTLDTIASNLSSYTDPTSLTGMLYYVVAALKPGPACMGTKSNGGPYSQSVSNMEDNGIFVGISSVLSSENILVYPNPAKDEIIIETTQRAYYTFRIEILNLQGQPVKIFNSAGNKTSIDISALPGGMYFVKVQSEKGIVVKRFVKE
jgi:hypothetical protein